MWPTTAAMPAAKPERPAADGQAQAGGHRALEEVAEKDQEPGPAAADAEGVRRPGVARPGRVGSNPNRRPTSSAVGKGAGQIGGHDHDAGDEPGRRSTARRMQ